MTTTQQAQPTSAVPAPDANQTDDKTVHVTADADSRLAQLQAARPAAVAAAAAAAEALKVINDGIKAELSQLVHAQDPCTTAMQADAFDGAPAVRLKYSESNRLDTTRLKKEDPETYVRYIKKSGSWTLVEVKG